jgi:hypothetical protein
LAFHKKNAPFYAVSRTVLSGTWEKEMQLQSAFCTPTRLAAVGILLCAANVALAQPSNDSCATPTPITGTGTFAFNLIGATTGAEGQSTQACDVPGTVPGIHNDVWFCWRATCTGTIRITTCNLTQVDTKIAIYPGCICPPVGAPPFCCNDDTNNAICGVQSTLDCEVVCCDFYLIQIGTKGGLPPGAGQFSIQCTGQECPQPCDGGGGHPPTCDGCCGKAPEFTGFRKAAIMTEQFADGPAGFVGNVLAVADISNEQGAPLGTIWPTTYHQPTGAQTWTLSDMGTVFGVTVDDLGNIYVAHTSIYGGWGGPGDANGSLPGTTAGTIFKVDTNSGVPTVLVNLPNFADPNVNASYVNPRPASELFPGLGDLTFDCGVNKLYASNFEDGRIYRIDPNGTILSSYDHATGSIDPWTGSPPEPNDPPGWARLGERVWAVKTTGGRMYYSIWREDYMPGFANRAAPNYSGANEIWSIAIAPVTGEFVGTAQLEITMPAYTNVGGDGVSNPVAGIAFTDDCCLIAAERTMVDDTSSGAHASRLLKFCHDGTRWNPSTALYDIMDSSTGGAAYDFGGPPQTQVNVWGMWDGAIATAYGGIGFPNGGGNYLNSILLDSDQSSEGQDKFEQGDIMVTCAGACMEIDDVQILCEIGSDGTLTGNYNVSFTLTNLSGVTAQYLLIPGSNVTPNVVVLPPLLNGQSTTINLVVTAQPGELVCLPMSLADETLNVCCADELCFTVPDCDCVQFPRCQTSCMDPVNGSFTLTFTIQNLTTDPVANLFLFPPVGSGVTITPNWFAVTPIANQFDIRGPYVVTISGATPGQTLCLLISIHDAALNECCSEQKCIEVPARCPPIIVPGDMNCDGLVNNFDIDPFVLAISDPAAYAAQYPDCNILNGDINGDGVVNNFDIDPFVNLISGG